MRLNLFVRSGQLSNMSQAHGHAHAWTNMSSQLKTAISKLDKAIASDKQFQAFANT
jgi:hypothetical protein